MEKVTNLEYRARRERGYIWADIEERMAWLRTVMGQPLYAEVVVTIRADRMKVLKITLTEKLED